MYHSTENKGKMMTWKGYPAEPLKRRHHPLTRVRTPEPQIITGAEMN